MCAKGWLQVTSSTALPLILNIYVWVCFGRFSIAKRNHDQGNLQKSLLGACLQFPRVRVHDHHGEENGRTQERKLHAYIWSINIRQRKKELTLLILPKQSTNCGPITQTLEPMEAVLTQPYFTPWFLQAKSCTIMQRISSTSKVPICSVSTVYKSQDSFETDSLRRLDYRLEL